MGFFDIGIVEIIVVLIVALLIVGPDKIPDYLRRFGKLVRTFKKMTSNLTDEMKKAMDLEEEVEALKKSAVEMKDTLKAEVTEMKDTLDADTKEIRETLTAEAKELKKTFDAEAGEPKKAVKEVEKKPETSPKDITGATAAESPKKKPAMPASDDDVDREL